MWAWIISILSWANDAAKVVGGVKAVLLAITVGLSSWMASDWWNEATHAIEINVVRRRTRRATIIELYKRCECPDWLDIWKDDGEWLHVTDEVLDNDNPPEVIFLAPPEPEPEPTLADPATQQAIQDAQASPNRFGWAGEQGTDYAGGKDVITANQKQETKNEPDR